MRRIYIIRHAKAEPKKQNNKDFQRNLNDKGKEDIKLITKALKQRDIKPDIVISSSANRCKESIKELCLELKFKNKIKFDDNLYMCDINYVLNLIKSIDFKFKDVFLMLHNPVATELCEYLTGCFVANLPTSSIFCMDIECEYKDIKKDCAKAIFFEYPKKYKS